MTLLANSLAVLLMTVVPFIRPCDCSDFTLFCHCAAESAEAHKLGDPAEPQCPM